MNSIDMRTVVLSYIISNGISIVVITSLWLQDRKRFAGPGFWLGNAILQFLGLLLIALRGILPNLISVTFSNTFVVGGIILLYIGLERFVGKPGRQVHNAILLGVYFLVYAYYTLEVPSLLARTILLCLGLIATCSQCAWLLLHRVGPVIRPITRSLGWIFVAYCLINLLRITVDLLAPTGNDFFHSNAFDTLVVLTYQMLYIILTLGLVLMVNRRLLLDLEQDIAQRREAEIRLRKLSRAVEQSPASIMITNTEGRIEYINPRFTQQTGYSAEEVLGQNPRLLQSGQTPREIYTQLWEALTHGREFHAEFVNKKKNGDLYYESASLSPIMNSRGEITHFLAVTENITDRKKAEAEIQRLQTELREQAIRDPLTGLYNRRYLNESLERELAQAEHENHPVSFVMIDLDHFKQLNDAYGHLGGDAVLKRLAAQVLSQSRVSDIICRYGGEEFLAVLPNTSAANTFQIAERWRRTFLDSTLPIETAHVRSTISCGISEFPTHGRTAEELIAAADKAMYQAKAAGRNQVIIGQSDRIEAALNSETVD